MNRNYYLKSAFCLFPLLLIASVGQAVTLTVDPSGTGDYTTIQDALFKARAGDEVAVKPGFYQENLVLTSGVRLVSLAGPEKTTIDGQGATCFEVQKCAHGTSSGGTSGMAVRQDDSQVIVTRNIFSGNLGGPALKTTKCQTVTCNIFWNNSVDHAGMCPPLGKMAM